MFIYGSPRAAVLAGPYIHWGWERLDADAEDPISKWTDAIPEVSRTEGVAGSVVDVLLQIATNPHLRPFIPADLWLWLNERPFLSPACSGLSWGYNYEVVQTVRALKDIGVLTSYLILIWSEWNPLRREIDFAEMRRSVCEDFKGIEMGRHRAELIQRLDYILRNLDWLSRHLDIRTEYQKLWHEELGNHSEGMKDRYGELKGVLQEVDQEATEMPNRMPPGFIILGLLILMDLHRISLDLHVCPASPVSISSHLERLARFSANRPVQPQSISSSFPLFPVDSEPLQFCLASRGTRCRLLSPP